MKINIGYELSYYCPQATPMLLMLNVHPSREADLVIPDTVTTVPYVPTTAYRDGFGNTCTRLIAPPGVLKIRSDAVIVDRGTLDVVNPNARQHPLEELPEDTLVYLLPSRYCETDLLNQTAWQLFGGYAPGWGRAQAIVDYVHHHIQFGYAYARPTKTAYEAFSEGRGVCRDFAHLAITFCRCLNIPARYCTGYLGDIGIPPVDAPMDFAGWFEAYLGGRWYTFDPRNWVPRIGRVLMARGRDAADVAIATTFGACGLEQFRVWTDEISAGQDQSTLRQDLAA